MPRAHINGVHLHYESYGSGFPLVLAYGLGGNTGMWAGQIEAFARHYRLILWDPRGHGQSDSPPRPDQYGVQISAEDLCGLLDQLGIELAYVGGQSMGGGIAARFALAYPERVAALLIIDSASASGLPMAAAMRAMREKTIELAETRGMEAVADYVITANPNLRTQAGASPEARQRLRQMFLELNPTGYAHTIRSLLAETFPAERLSTLTMPTLVLVGDEDPALEAAKVPHQKIRGCQLVVLPQAGHLSNLDAPEAFNRSVLAFLHQVASLASSASSPRRSTEDRSSRRLKRRPTANPLHEADTRGDQADCTEESIR
jgi:3-oxoadipate enol-lactonase